MLTCWNETVSLRPSFSDLQAKLDRMLSTEGNNPYIDFSINPNNLCYQVADESDAQSNGLLHIQPNGTKIRNQLSFRRGSNTSVNISHSSSKNLLQGSRSPSPSLRCARTPSPTMEKPHATNSCFEVEESSRRPRSMMLLRGRDMSQKTDDDRFDE